MESEIVERMNDVLKEKNISVSKFGRMFGVSQPVMSLYMSKSRKMPLYLVEGFLNNYRDISPSWLILGIGNKYVGENVNVNADNSIVADNNHGSVTQNNGVDVGSSSMLIALKMFFKAIGSCGSDAEKIALMEDLKGLVENK